jgi:hypothetical protein
MANRAKQAPDNDFGEEAPAQAFQATPPGLKAAVAEASGEEVVVRKPVLRNREVTRSVELAESRWVNIKPQGRDASGDRMERCGDDGGAVALVARRSQSPNARLVASRLVAAPLWSLARVVPSGSSVVVTSPVARRTGSHPRRTQNLVQGSDPPDHPQPGEQTRSSDGHRLASGNPTRIGVASSVTE